MGHTLEKRQQLESFAVASYFADPSPKMYDLARRLGPSWRFESQQKCCDVKLIFKLKIVLMF